MNFNNNVLNPALDSDLEVLDLDVRKRPSSLWEDSPEATSCNKRPCTAWLKYPMDDQDAKWINPQMFQAQAPGPSNGVLHQQSNSPDSESETLEPPSGSSSVDVRGEDHPDDNFFDLISFDNNDSPPTLNLHTPLFSQELNHNPVNFVKEYEVFLANRLNAILSEAHQIGRFLLEHHVPLDGMHIFHVQQICQLFEAGHNAAQI